MAKPVTAGALTGSDGIGPEQLLIFLAYVLNATPYTRLCGVCILGEVKKNMPICCI
jgi:hypothetical protein